MPCSEKNYALVYKIRLSTDLGRKIASWLHAESMYIKHSFSDTKPRYVGRVRTYKYECLYFYLEYSSNDGFDESYSLTRRTMKPNDPVKEQPSFEQVLYWIGLRYPNEIEGIENRVFDDSIYF